MVADEKEAGCETERETDAKAEILAKISVVEVAKVEVLP